MSDIIPEGILYGNLGVGSGTTNYNDLDNKPQINSVTLQGNKTASELGLVGTSDIPVTSVNGETGAVVLDGTEIEFSTGVSLNEKIIAVEQEIPVIAYPVTSVNGETGAVVLDGTEINYQAGKTINQKIDEVEAEIPVVSYPVTSVNGETGAVVLDGTEIEYSSGVSVNSQIDTLMQYTPVYGNTASGAIATFDTSLALPLQDCTIDINAVQESGTPTPSSPKAISGFTGANIRVTDGNGSVTSDYTLNYYLNSSGEETSSNSWTITNYIEVSGSTLYYNGLTSVGTNPYSAFYDENKNLITPTFKQAVGENTIAIPSGAKYVRFSVTHTDRTNFYCTNVASVTAITWQDEAGTVYGGSLDVTSGVLTVRHWAHIFNGSESFAQYETNKWRWDCQTLLKSSYINQSATKCSHFLVETAGGGWSDLTENHFMIAGNQLIAFGYNGTISTFLTTEYNNGTPVTVIALLQTPVTYQLTPTQISAIVGTNNVFTDTNGDTSVVYACSLKDYIDGQ